MTQDELLRAAAPDMLRALKLVLPAITAVSKESGDSGEFWIYLQVVNAINKAEGKPQNDFKVELVRADEVKIGDYILGGGEIRQVTKDYSEDNQSISCNSYFSYFDASSLVARISLPFAGVEE